jgi:hypothetical protein
MKYRIYIDETGNSDIESSEDPNHRFFSLTGVAISLDHVQATIHPRMEALKARYFRSHPDEPVILHRKELQHKNYPFECLRDGDTCAAFDEEFLGCLESWRYVVFSVCIDKKRHKDMYTVWRYDPYHYCLALLLERSMFYLERLGAKGDVMAESRGGREDRRLKDSFERLMNKGTDYISPERFQAVLTSKQLKVKSKANNIAGLQLADVIAHPSRNEILLENRLITKQMAPFSQRIVDILQRKYDQYGGRIFGKKMIP